MATTNEQLIGRIAEILNAREVVITLGREHGIELGMKFSILTDPLEIKDPVSGEVLDILEREKTRVEVVQVRSKISICRPYRSKPFSIPSLTRHPLSVISSLEVPEVLSVPKDAASRAAPYAEEYVKVGDRVRNLVEEDD